MDQKKVSADYNLLKVFRCRAPEDAEVFVSRNRDGKLVITVMSKKTAVDQPEEITDN